MLTLVIAAVPLCLVSNMSVAQDSGNSSSNGCKVGASCPYTLIIRCSAASGGGNPYIRSNETGTSKDDEFGFGKIDSNGISFNVAGKKTRVSDFKNFKKGSASTFKNDSSISQLILTYTCGVTATDGIFL